jgi:hypothetical protein
MAKAAKEKGDVEASRGSGARAFFGCIHKP